MIETEQQPGAPDLPIWEPTPRAAPDPEFVDALMCVVQAHNSGYSEKAKREDGIPDSVTLVRVAKNSYRFVPPVRLVPECARNNFEGAQFLSDVADRVLFKAQEVVFGQEALSQYFAQRVNPSGVQSISRAYTAGRGEESLWIQVDTAKTSNTSAEISAEIAMLVGKIRAKYRAAVEAVLQDGVAMREIQRVVEVRQAVQAGVVLEGEIDYLDHVRAQVETPQDQEAFKRIMTEMVRAIGYKDVDVQLLSTEKAIVWGAQGLYQPHAETGRGVVQIPMSKYGTDQLLEWDDILKILAHELSHHRNRGGDESHGGHHLLHTMMAGNNLRRLRELRFTWRDVRKKEELKVVPPEPVSAPASSKRAAVQNVRDEQATQDNGGDKVKGIPWWKFWEGRE